MKVRAGAEDRREGAAPARKTFVVVSHTHWDREWYAPFEEFRVRLVRMMDALLDLLDRDPEYRHFVMDGQTVPIDDYLEVRPDRRPAIERLVREGRLLAGPNYMLPDEFLIGGEAHIRNLMFGIRSARAYGRAMMVGYAPDAFGHIAHLPAILRGFGLDAVLIWRGVGPEVTKSEFRWAAPDGAEVLALHFPHGYGFLAEVPDDKTALANVLRNVRAALEPYAGTRYVLVPNGTDHLPAVESLSSVIKAANAILGDAEMVHGDYPTYLSLVRRELDAEGRYESLERVEGELRNSKRSCILAGVLSTRMWVKQRYQQCEDLLARYAEPFSAWANALRAADDPLAGQRAASDQGLLRHAWKLLLQNGPHDSVTGCSVDAVYDDVRQRFNKVEQIGEAVLFESQRYIAGRAAPPEGAVVVFNPDGGPRSDFVTVRLPAEPGRFPVALTDGDGRRIPLQTIERGLYSPRDGRERIAAGFVAPDVPAFGYRALRIETAAGPAPGRVDKPGDSIENEYLRVSAAREDGALAVLDKRSGRHFTGLNRFVDGGEAGDEYTYCPPAEDHFVDRPDGPPTVRVIEDGPARYTLEVASVYALPARLTEDRQRRSPELRECAIVTRVSLYPGVPRVEIETEVDNNAEDHRLRVHFPTGIKSSSSFAEQHFGVVERPVALPEYDGTWFEAPVGTYPQKTFAFITDGRAGLMLANRGLPEYEAIEGPDGAVTLALTLLRCVSWLSRNDLRTRPVGHAGPPMYTPGAQMPGRWRFHYAVIPFEGDWLPAAREAHLFARPLRALRASRGTGALPPASSLASIDQQAFVLSALKPAEEGAAVVLRVYNIAGEPREGVVRLHLPFRAVERVDLNEERPEPLSANDGGVRLLLQRNEIATLRFTL